MTRRRGDSEDPHPDYHDQGIPPGTRKTRPSAEACRRSAETGRSTPTNKKEHQVTIAPNRTVTQPPTWTVEYDPETGKSFAMGPAVWEPGIDIYTALDSHAGPRAYDADGNVIPTGDLLRYACRLLRLHDALRTAQKEAQR